MTAPFTIRTARLELVQTNPAILRADAASADVLAGLLRCDVPSEWPPELFADHKSDFADRLERGEWPGIAAPWYWIFDDGRSRRVLVGSGGVMPLAEPPGDMMCGYALIPSFHGRGLATEAMLAALRWAFSLPGVERVVADTFPHLRSSIRVMEKLGMTLLGPGGEAGTERRGVRRAEFERRMRAG